MVFRTPVLPESHAVLNRSYFQLCDSVLRAVSEGTNNVRFTFYCVAPWLTGTVDRYDGQTFKSRPRIRRSGRSQYQFRIFQGRLHPSLPLLDSGLPVSSKLPLIFLLILRQLQACHHAPRIHPSQVPHPFVRLLFGLARFTTLDNRLFAMDQPARAEAHCRYHAQYLNRVVPGSLGRFRP